MPGLDGIRALAVLAVIAYHLDFGWASGGLLGVGMFFTLSGYLITDLLLAQWDEQRLKLGDFWIRRARRLLPALFVMLIVVSLWVAVLDRSRLTDLRGGVWSAVLYINNWWQISQNMSYFARFAPPSPLSHLWSLAVEEQFYLIWPWLLLLGLEVRPRAPAADEGQDPPAPGRRDAGPGRGVRDRDGGPLSPQLRRDSDLRRHGHARVRAAVRRRAGDGLAEPRADQEHRAAGSDDPRRRAASPAC